MKMEFHRIVFLILLSSAISSLFRFCDSFPLNHHNDAALRSRQSPSAATSVHSRSRPSHLYIVPPILQEEPELPQENPNADLSRRSTSGVVYGHVLDSLLQLYPPHELEQRHATSRTDGYWPYIRDGLDPPLPFTYGEFDLYFFANLLDMCWAENDGNNGSSRTGCDGKVLVDMGSGAGRLVLAAAALHPGFKECRGIEVLPGLHTVALEKLQACCVDQSLSSSSDKQTYSLPNGGTTGTDRDRLPLAPVSLVCGSLEDPDVYFGDADAIFVTASCLPTELLSSLHNAVLRQCRAGTIVMSTDYSLPLNENQHDTLKIELCRKVEGWSWVTGGDSTAFVHRVVEK